MEKRDLVDILRAALDAATQPEHWDRLCEMIASRADLSAFFVYEYDPDAAMAPLLHYSDRMRQAEGQRILTALTCGDPPSAEHELYLRLRELRSHKQVFEQEMFGLDSEAKLPSNPLRDEVLAFTGGLRRFGGRLNDIGPFIDIAAGHTRHDINRYGPEEREDFGLLFAALGKALEAGRVFRRLSSSYQRLLDLFDGLDFGVAFCDPAGNIVTANACFRELAAERDGLTALNGVVGASDAEDRSTLLRLLRSAVEPASRGGDLVMQLRRRSRRRPLVVRAMAVQERQAGAAIPLSLLLVLDPERRRMPGTDGLATFGLLSPAELEICDMLVQGCETRVIAEQRSTTLETTRGQIKQLNAKLGCRHRLDLLRLAMMTTAPLRGADDPGDGRAGKISPDS